MWSFSFFIGYPKANGRGELTTSYRWTDGAWEIAGWRFQDFKAFDHRVRGIYGIYLELIKNNRKIARFRPITFGNLHGHCLRCVLDDQLSCIAASRISNIILSSKPDRDQWLEGIKIGTKPLPVIRVVLWNYYRGSQIFKYWLDLIHNCGF
jgi:hypothetical protein